MGLTASVSYNGSLHPADAVSIMPASRGFRYGDGFFETIRMTDGHIPLLSLHLERLFATMDALQFQRPEALTASYFTQQLEQVARTNGHEKSARLRITVFRNDEGFFHVKDHFPHHLVQSTPLDPAYPDFNTQGLSVGFFTEAKKVCDGFSSLKHNNYLPYSMAALWAGKNGLDDAILLNPYHRIADATIANVFVVSNGRIKTPPLSEGPVGGVMRRFLLEKMMEQRLPVEQIPLSPDELASAEEIFLTNALYGIRWVARLGAKAYGNSYTRHLRSLLLNN